MGSIDNVIVVEGYMDTISVYQKGVKNIVASMGTSLTKQQAKLLKRYTERVTICYDGDFAGQKGAIRGLEILKEEGLDVKIAFIPDKMDPDDVINKQGVDAFNEIIKNAKPLIKFKLSLIEEKYGEKSNLPDKKKLIDLSIGIIRESDSAAEQEELLKELRDKTGITYESLKRDFEKGESTKSNYNDNFVIEKPKDTSDKILKAKRHILACALYKKDYVSKIDLEDFIFNNPVHEKMLEKILTGCTIQSACSDFTDEELGEVNMIISDENKIFDSPGELKYFEDCVTVVKIDELENELKELNKTFEQETNIASRQMLMKLIQDKTMQMVKLKKRRINS